MDSKKTRSSLVLVMLIATSLFLSNCGGHTLNKSVDFKIRPEVPVIIKADKDLDCKGPWFNIILSVQNNSDRYVMAQSLHLEMTGQNKAGGQVTGTADSLAEDGSTYAPYLAVIAPGKLVSGVLTVCNAPESADLSLSVQAELKGWFSTTDSTKDIIAQTTATNCTDYFWASCAPAVEAEKRLEKFQTFDVQ